MIRREIPFGCAGSKAGCAGRSDRNLSAGDSFTVMDVRPPH